MQVAYSVNGVPIRLTDERWSHIVDVRDELEDREDDVLDAVARPDWVTRGYHGSLMAWKGYGRRGFLVVVYEESSEDDGFVIAAYVSRRPVKGNKTWAK